MKSKINQLLSSINLLMYISKSKYLSGLQCHKLLWHQYNAKHLIPEFDAATQVMFDQGHLVGEYAKKLFPDGVEVCKGIFDIGELIQRSVPALKLHKPLFEAFAYKNAFARADILNPIHGNQWDIIEVKSSTEVKGVNLLDLAIQRYTYEGAGLDIRNCCILHINNQYVRKGDIDPEQLFVCEDVTAQVSELLPTVEVNLLEMGKIILLKKSPELPIGPHCSDPYDCPLIEVCWNYLPKNNVFKITRMGKKGYDLLSRGILNIKDIPANYAFSDAQEIEYEAVCKNKVNVDKDSIRSFLADLEYPLYLLDFETFMTAIPMYDDVSPYEQIPFQYSLHRIDTPESIPVHSMVLADGKTDPRREILSKLKNELGTKGSIIAYNAAFEKRILQSSIGHYSDYAAWLERVEKRFVDLMKPFSSHSYYHPEQCGSYSIKSVLPALCGKSYDDMEISEGGTASQEYLRVTFGDVTDEERARVRGYLEEYCTMDTQAMIDILAQLQKLCI
jgi:hypothetical protein